MQIKIDLTTLQRMLREVEPTSLNMLREALLEAIDAEARKVASEARRLAFKRATWETSRTLDPYGPYTRPAEIDVETPEQTAARRAQLPEALLAPWRRFVEQRYPSGPRCAGGGDGDAQS